MNASVNALVHPANALSGIIDEDICKDKSKGKYVCVGTKIKDGNERASMRRFCAKMYMPHRPVCEGAFLLPVIVLNTFTHTVPDLRH